MGVLEVAHGGEGDVDDAVDVVVALLHLGAEDADDFEAESVDANGLAQGTAAGEEFFLGFGADDGDAGALPLGLESAQLIAITEWARQRWHPSQVTLESGGYRMQLVSLVAGALQPRLFGSITIHHGVRSLTDLLVESVKSNQVPDVFCLDLYKDFDLNMLKAMAEPARVTESDYVDLTAAKQ